MYRILLYSNLNNVKWIIIGNKFYVYVMINLVGYRYFFFNKGKCILRKR